MFNNIDKIKEKSKFYFFKYYIENNNFKISYFFSYWFLKKIDAGST